MKTKLCVRKRTLLLIAGIVWMIAGFNVARLGVMSYMKVERKWYLYLMSLIVFLLFGLMFFKMSKKHTKRILGYEERRPFWHLHMSTEKSVNRSLKIRSLLTWFGTCRIPAAGAVTT